MRQRLAGFARLAPAVMLAFSVSCRSVDPDSLAREPGDAPTIRFLLTFDDGPSIRQPVNPTLQILDQLATNDLQSGIKAIFFVQTGHPRGGGTPQGRDVMRRIHADGHILALHSTSPRGHIDHTQVSTNELVLSLMEAQKILQEITGTPPLFVRSPFGAYNLTTRRIYMDLGLHLLMADLRARDGVIYGYNGSLRRRSYLRNRLASVYQEVLAQGGDDAPVDVVLNFHDVNPYTARHMTEYLHILVEEAQRVGFHVPVQPFCDRRDQLTDRALCRCVPRPPHPCVAGASRAADLERCPLTAGVPTRPGGSL
jgi:peptidoglycan/xylan/chitin deacetylase (PgdA/CDA1 family)